MILCDLKSKGISGNKAELICDFVNITINKNTIPGDTSALNPSGIRVGTPALTNRGFIEKDFIQVVDYLDQTLTIGATIIKNNDKLSNKEFVEILSNNTELLQLKDKIAEFANQFPFYE